MTWPVPALPGMLQANQGIHRFNDQRVFELAQISRVESLPDNLLQVRSRRQRLVKNKNILPQFLRHSRSGRSQQYQRAARGLECISEIPDSLHHCRIIPEAVDV